MIDCCFVDMDGVLCDLHKALLTLHDRMDLYDQVSSFELETALGISTAALWQPVLDIGADFWRTLEMFPWAPGVMDFARSIAYDVILLTRPLCLSGPSTKNSGDCVDGKYAWIKENMQALKLRGHLRDVIVTARKDLLSQPRRVLIDDDEQYVAEFGKQGGYQLILPQPYNRHSNKCHNRLNAIRDQYAKFYKDSGW